MNGLYFDSRVLPLKKWELELEGGPLYILGAHLVFGMR